MSSVNFSVILERPKSDRTQVVDCTLGTFACQRHCVSSGGSDAGCEWRPRRDGPASVRSQGSQSAAPNYTCSLSPRGVCVQLSNIREISAPKTQLRLLSKRKSVNIFDAEDLFFQTSTAQLGFTQHALRVCQTPNHLNRERSSCPQRHLKHQLLFSEQFHVLIPDSDASLSCKIQTPQEIRTPDNQKNRNIRAPDMQERLEP